MLIVLHGRAVDATPFRSAASVGARDVAAGAHADVEAAVAHVEESAAAFALRVATTACGPLLVEAACQLAMR